MTRTASIGSRVPPAVTRTWRPARSGAVSDLGHRGHDVLRRGQPAGAHVPSGQASDRGLHHDHSPPAERGQVVLDGRVLPHLGVHRRADDDGSAGGQQRGDEEVTRDPRRVRAEHPGRRRRDHDQVGLLTQPGVRDGVGVVPQRCVRRLAGQGRERGGADEALGAAGEDGHDVGAGIDQAATDLDGLVGGDAPGDAEDHAPPGEHAHRLAQPISSGASSPATAAGRQLGVVRFRRQLHRDDLVGGDLLEADGQRLASDRGDLRRHDGPEALTQLAEVGVDLAGPAGGESDQRELGVDPPEELLDWQGSSSCRACEPSILRRCEPIKHTWPGPGRTVRPGGASRLAVDPPYEPDAFGLDDGQHLLDGLLEVVVDHHMVGQCHADGLLVLGLAQALRHLGVRVPPAHEPALLLLARRRQHEDQDGVGPLRLDLAGRRPPRSPAPGPAPGAPRASACRSSGRGTRSTRGTRPGRIRASKSSRDTNT